MTNDKANRIHLELRLAELQRDIDLYGDRWEYSDRLDERVAEAEDAAGVAGLDTEAREVLFRVRRTYELYNNYGEEQFEDLESYESDEAAIEAIEAFRNEQGL